jgi:hypothetical protein
MKITPLLSPVLNWPGFTTEVHQALGRSPLANLMQAGAKAGPLKTMPAALGEFAKANTPAVPYLRTPEAEQTLRLLHVGFLIEAEEVDILRIKFSARVQLLFPSESRTLVIAVASLAEWREMIQQSRENPILTEIQAMLTDAGFRDLFPHQRKQL